MLWKYQVWFKADILQLLLVFLSYYSKLTAASCFHVTHSSPEHWLSSLSPLERFSDQPILFPDLICKSRKSIRNVKWKHTPSNSFRIGTLISSAPLTVGEFTVKYCFFFPFLFKSPGEFWPTQHWAAFHYSSRRSSSQATSSLFNKHVKEWNKAYRDKVKRSRLVKVHVPYRGDKDCQQGE